MDKCKEFCQTVLKYTPRATSDERDEITRELMAHLEDHQDALVSRGLAPEEAERRAITEMGDPCEIGQQLNAELKPFWLYLNYVCKAASVLLILGIFLPGCVLLYQIYNNVEARFVTAADFKSTDDTAIVYTDCDIRFNVEGHTVRILRYGTCTNEGRTGVHIDAVTYPSNVLDLCSGNLLQSLKVDAYESTSGGGHSSAGAAYWSSFTPFPAGTEQATLIFDRYGTHWEARLPLDWGDAA